MPIDYKGLREFLKRGEGASPPVFVGRKNIIDDIIMASGKPADEAKMTRIVQGAPGAGKSSLLKELRRQAGNAHVPILMTGDINTPVDILGPIARMLSKRHAPEFLVVHSHTRSFGLGVGTESVGARIGRERTRTEAVPPATWESLRLWAEANDCLPNRPVILTIDEAQRFRLEPDAPVAKILQGIHDGTTGLPVVLVLSGLSDTADRARKMDLTRGRTIHEVEPLTRDETMSLITGFCGKYGIDPSRHLSQLDALATPCEGWPRHLHFALRALTEETLRAHGDMDRFDWADLEKRTLKSRREYYQDQCSSSMRAAKNLVAAVLDGIPSRRNRETKPMDQADVMVSIARHRRVGELPQDIPWHLPGNMDIEGFLNHLIHQGALYEDRQGYFHSPIPSFRSYLIERGTEPEPRLTADRQDNPGPHTDPSP